MAQSAIGAALGFFNTVTTRVMVGVKGNEEAVLGLPEDMIKRLADEFAQKLVSVVEEAKNLLKFLRTVSVPAVEKFIAVEAFGDNNSAGVKFYLGGNFKQYFFGKVENNVSAMELNIHELRKGSLDAPIRAELSSEHEETMLAQLYELLKKQPKGDAGSLLVNGSWNIFYIKDVHGNLWAVLARWNADNREWDVDAYSVTFPYEWGAGFRVVSRKSA